MTARSGPPAGAGGYLARAVAVLVIVAVAGALLADLLASCGAGSRPTSTGHSSGSSTAPPPTAPNRAPPSSPPVPTVIDSPTCTPPSQRPYPVVLLPGTFDFTSWRLIAPQLANLGYCVYVFNYGNRGTASIATSAHQLAAFVDGLLARTRAPRVSIVGHSEGGLMARYYVKYLGGAAKVEDLIGLAPSNHGTINPLLFGGVLTGCFACAQQRSGSPFLTRLNGGDETPPPVNYTVIETLYDQVVVPYTSAFLTGPSSHLTNITLQSSCPTDYVGHIGITSDPVALQWVENALARRAPADPNFTPSC
jgi:triacylglycerol lipase